METFWFFRLRFRRAYDSAYDSDFWFSLGHKRSYDSDYASDSDSVASENQPLTGGIWKRRLCVFAWTENILKRELFRNDEGAIIMWFPCPSFRETQIQNDRWLLHFPISPVLVWKENIWCVKSLQRSGAGSKCQQPHVLSSARGSCAVILFLIGQWPVGNPT